MFNDPTVDTNILIVLPLIKIIDFLFDIIENCKCFKIRMKELKPVKQNKKQKQ